VTLLAVPAVVVASYLVISYQPFLGGAVRDGNDSHFLRNQEYVYALPDGTIERVEISINRGDPRSTGGFVSRAAGNPQPGDQNADLPANRLRAQLDLLVDETGLLGHGTGRMTLGSQYLLPTRSVASESQFVKVAYELGVLGLLSLVVLLFALWAAAAWASFVSPEWRRPPAAVALGIATLVPALTALTFAFDYPVVSILYYTLGGCALAWAIEGRRGRQPIPTAPPALPGAASAAPSRAPA
jgi:hypothetical protein